MIFPEEFCLALPKTHGATTATTTALHLAHKEHEHRKNQQNREAGDQQLRPYRLLLRLFTLDNHVVSEQVIHQLGVLDHWPHRLKAGAVFAFR